LSFYKTISKPCEGIYKEKGSKFFAYLHPIVNEEEGRVLLKDYKKKYFDARHHCHAMILGKYSELQKFSDDGEPGHTAGTPILNRLKSSELTNVICIVVRFFGGTKLGVPGLIEAYKEATSDAITNAQIVECPITEKINLVTDYLNVNEVMRLVKLFDAELVSQNFTDTHVEFEIGVIVSQKEEMVAAMAKNYKIELLN
jgi:uncharacterized YigZ family protein